ncbi:Beta-barrel assembly machine subunit BamF [Arboricoccus pini]|uniref:Beta-barrel assembly machine subunit BamF n=1 Tax=Arboricoccus pini TaxID=1963835 RepID=A0A212Q401_9PROT|nr:DUF3035 domain-containing protein [Arboricoccus pini]SNB54006.1 Beta-barrel assembly machine subunit BamF [Arboricoccus pini]
MRLPVLARLGAFSLLTIGLAGCSSTVQDAFGLSKRSPDEFQVVRRAPLVVPPDYRLRPPGAGTGTTAPAANSTSQDAYTALTGQPAQPDTAMSPAEQTLVSQMPQRSIPDIRQTVNNEGDQVATLDRGSYLFLFTWQRADDQAQGTVLDPLAESQRLRQNGIVTTRRLQSTPLQP